MTQLSSAEVSKETTNRARQQLWAIVRIGIGVCALAFVLYSVGLDKLAQTLGQVRPLYLLLLLILVFTAVVLSTFRWLLLLRTQGIHVPYRAAFSLYMIAHFFTLIVPSFLAADVVRVLETNKKIPQTSANTASIVVERLTGLVALSGMGLAAIFFSPQVQHFPLIILLTLGLFMASLVALFFVLHPHWIGSIARFVSWPRVSNFLNGLQEASNIFRQNPRSIYLTLLASGLVQIVGIIAFYVQIPALGKEVSFFSAVTVAPIILVSATIPISPSALGVQEGVYVLMMSSLGIAPIDAVAMSMLSRVANIILGLCGGFFYMFR